MASLLPMGIFVNTTEVYEEIAGYSVVPPDKLREYWKGTNAPSRQLSVQALPLTHDLSVYTTTARRLRDPKARRLENFWWHVWGSNKRSLSGPQLARLFEDFSNSPPIVPLRYPTNRYEGPPVRVHNDCCADVPLLIISSRYLGASPRPNHHNRQRPRAKPRDRARMAPPTSCLPLRPLRQARPRQPRRHRGGLRLRERAQRPRWCHRQTGKRKMERLCQAALWQAHPRRRTSGTRSYQAQ